MSEGDDFTIFKNEPDGGNQRYYIKMKFKLIMIKLKMMKYDNE